MILQTPKTQTHHKNKAKNPLIIEQTGKNKYRPFCSDILPHRSHTHAGVQKKKRGVTTKNRGWGGVALSLKHTHAHKPKVLQSALSLLSLLYAEERPISRLPAVALHSRTVWGGFSAYLFFLFVFLSKQKVSTSKMKLHFWVFGRRGMRGNADGYSTKRGHQCLFPFKKLNAKLQTEE